MKEKIDRDLFYLWLWETRGRKDVVSMTGREIAKHFSFSPFTPTRLLAELVREGKVKKNRKGNFTVINPDLIK